MTQTNARSTVRREGDMFVACDLAVPDAACALIQALRTTPARVGTSCAGLSGLPQQGRHAHTAKQFNSLSLNIAGLAVVLTVIAALCSARKSRWRVCTSLIQARESSSLTQALALQRCPVCPC